MKERTMGTLALVTALLTAVWLGLLVWDQTRAAAAPDSMVRLLERVASLPWDYVLLYVDAALITLAATALFGGLYRWAAGRSPVWTTFALTCTCVYCMLNLVVYLSQITLVPGLLRLSATPNTERIGQVLLQLAVQTWPGSAAALLNVLAYAVLAIPSIIYGLALLQAGRRAQPVSLGVAGILLILSGLACLAGFVGLVVGSQMLAMGTVVGGGLFLLALLPLALGFYQLPNWAGQG